MYEPFLGYVVNRQWAKYKIDTAGSAIEMHSSNSNYTEGIRYPTVSSLPSAQRLLVLCLFKNVHFDRGFDLNLIVALLLGRGKSFFVIFCRRCGIISVRIKQGFLWQR